MDGVLILGFRGVMDGVLVLGFGVSCGEVAGCRPPETGEGC